MQRITANPSFAVRGFWHGKVFCFQWRHALGLHHKVASLTAASAGAEMRGGGWCGRVIRS